MDLKHFTNVLHDNFESITQSVFKSILNIKPKVVVLVLEDTVLTKQKGDFFINSGDIVVDQNELLNEFKNFYCNYEEIYNNCNENVNKLNPYSIVPFCITPFFINAFKLVENIAETYDTLGKIKDFATSNYIFTGNIPKLIIDENDKKYWIYLFVDLSHFFESKYDFDRLQKVEKPEYYNIVINEVSTFIIDYFYQLANYPLVEHTMDDGKVRISLDSVSSLLKSVASKTFFGVFCKFGIFERFPISEKDLTLFDDICNVSELKYEGEKIDGKVIFTPSIHYVNLIFEFDDDVGISDHKYFRKVAELTTSTTYVDDMYLISDGKHLIGLGKLKNEFKDKILIVKLNNFSHWTLTHYLNNQENPIFHIKNRTPVFSKEKFNEWELIYKLVKLKSLKKNNLMKRIILKSIEQTHGTILVFSNKAEEEALRLNKFGINIKSKFVKEEEMLSITSIDGAVLLDFDCKVHSIGIILDGVSDEDGDRSRGARYNSSIKYISSQKKMYDDLKLLIVVISEDGYIDIHSSV